MPLPIETPAPKASSIIKRFQQTIDNLDGQPSLPLPKKRLSQDPQEIAQNRRSWSVGSGGAPLPPNNLVNWTPPTKHASPSPPIVTKSPSPPPPQAPNHLKPDQEPSAENLDSLLNPAISTQPSDHLSSLNELSQSDLAVQTPPTSSSKSPKPPSSSAKLKASITSDVRQPIRPRKHTNVTAPTAASLAKIRASDPPQPNIPTPRNPSTNASLASHTAANNALKTGTTPKSSKTTISPRIAPERSFSKDSDPAHIRDVRAASAGTPKDRPRKESVRASTPAPSNSLKKAVIAKTKVPPIPTLGSQPANPSGLKASTTSPASSTVKATRRVISSDPHKSTAPTKPQSVANSAGSSTKSDKRPLQRARVVSAATPISGIKKSPSLKTSAGQSAARVPNVAGAKLTVTGTSGTTRSPDISAPKAKTRVSSTKVSSTVKKSPKLPSVPLPDTKADQVAAKSPKKPHASHLPTSFRTKSTSPNPVQPTTDTLPSEEPKTAVRLGFPKDPLANSVEQANDLQNPMATAGKVEAELAAEASSMARFEDPVAISADQGVELNGGNHHATHPPNQVVKDMPPENMAGQEALVLQELQGLKLAHHQQPSPAEVKHVLGEPDEDDELFRRDFDASTTTNTDGEE